ncbi:hypothetical protein ACXYMT_12805 [Salinimicrobium sp. CAU 1759]
MNRQNFKRSFIAAGIFSMLLTGIVSLAIFVGCEPENLQDSETLSLQAKVNKSVKAKQNVVEVVTDHMDLKVPSRIPSGWTTFEYINNGHAPHFFVIERMPEGKTFEDSKAEIVPVFQDAMDAIVAEDWDKMNEAFAALNEVEWYKEVVFTGGPGIVSEGHTARSTVYLEPGTYTIECYVKNENNVFHVTMGMIEGFTVTEDENGYDEPKSTMQVNISNASGISFDDKIRPGKQIIKINFRDQTTYAHALGHDVHLVKLEKNADVEGLNDWMNWSSPAGLLTPVPAGVTFLGGMQELPAEDDNYESGVGYIETRLEPGTYAFIAEIPDPKSHNMFKIFSVPSAR